MNNLTVQHIIILRLLMNFPIVNSFFLHNLLFLASAESLNQHEIGFYDFIRTSQGAFSPTIYNILEELSVNKLIKADTMEMQKKGRDTYYNLAGVLIGYHDYTDRCIVTFNRLGDDPAKVFQAVSHHLVFRKSNKGDRVFLKKEHFK